MEIVIEREAPEYLFDGKGFFVKYEMLDYSKFSMQMTLLSHYLHKELWSITCIWAPRSAEQVTPPPY